MSQSKAGASPLIKASKRDRQPSAKAIALGFHPMPQDPDYAVDQPCDEATTQRSGSARQVPEGQRKLRKFHVLTKRARVGQTTGPGVRKRLAAAQRTAWTGQRAGYDSLTNKWNGIK